MLQNTFVHIPGLGLETERSLWEQGCRTWQELSDSLGYYSVGQADRDIVKRTLTRSAKSLDKRDGTFFRKGLGLKEAWRAFPEFRDSIVYLDIETDGGTSGSSITTIGMYDGVEFRCLIKGRDLAAFPEAIAPYGMVVTFFGASFDLPMLQKRFPDQRFDQIHLDLCPTLRQLGITGGLKRIEKQLGISRGEDTDGMGGLDAIRLWRRFENFRDERALETLVAYNREDVVNLEYLAGYAYEHLRKRTFPYAEPKPAL